MKIHLIAGTRPNFVKIAPLHRAMSETDWLEPVIVHTGQHYDHNMSQAFFEDFGLPSPEIELEVFGGDSVSQIARIAEKYYNILLKEKPDLIIVVGDCNAAVGGAIAGKLSNVPIAHLEAGLRSRDYEMPEENNRILVDSIADRLWTPSEDAEINLVAEGISCFKIEMVGNVMLDTLEMMRDKINDHPTRKQPYCFVTCHRPSNVDNPIRLAEIVTALNHIAEDITMVFPVHPRTAARLEKCRAKLSDNVQVVEPLNYTSTIALAQNASFVITDSGGLQEETTYLGVPCLTVRENTERPITEDKGTNILVKPSELYNATKTLSGVKLKQIKNWDGKTSQRIIKDIERLFNYESND